MRSLHLEKKGLRGLAIAESFLPNSLNSIFSGIVMRCDFVIDDFVFGNATLGGDDATDSILKMYDELDRPDVSYVLISGLIVSMYNIIDIKKLFDYLKIPIIGVSYNDSKEYTNPLISRGRGVSKVKNSRVSGCANRDAVLMRAPSRGCG